MKSIRYDSWEVVYIQNNPFTTIEQFYHEAMSQRPLLEKRKIKWTPLTAKTNTVDYLHTHLFLDTNLKIRVLSYRQLIISNLEVYLIEN